MFHILRLVDAHYGVGYRGWSKRNRRTYTYLRYAVQELCLRGLFFRFSLGVCPSNIFLCVM